MYRKDRDSRGGGVLLALSNRFRSQQIQSPPHLECLLIQVSTPKPLFVSFTFLLVLILPITLLSSISFLFLPIIPRLFYWVISIVLMSTGRPSRLLSIHLVYCYFVFDNDLCQLVVLPTHIHGNILDLVLVCSPDLISNLHVHTNQPQFPSSDHFPITFTLHFPICQLFALLFNLLSTIEVITRVSRTFYCPLISLFSSLRRILIFFGRV